LARSMTNPPPLAMPPVPDLNLLPRYLPKEALASLHDRYYGPLSPRTLRERWPLRWREVNGRLVSSVPEFFQEAQRRFDAAEVVGPLVKSVA